MSTTFNIIPTSTSNITFGQVLESSERHIQAFLQSVGIEASVQLRVYLHENREKYVRDIPLSSKFEWGAHEYVWFSIHGIAGGSDAYCGTLKDDIIDAEDPWWRLEELVLNNTGIKNIQEKLEQTKPFNRLWSFRRSAGQPGIMALSYGLIAASVAELTQGIIWSDDSAWDHERFPAESKDFLEWYFRPEQALSAETAEWSKRCIDGIQAELTAPESPLVKRTWWQKLFGSE